MKYYKLNNNEVEPMQITKEEARYFLGGYYKKSFVDEVIEGEQVFRLKTPYAEIWTKTDDGLVPMPGFYGVCG